MSAAINMEIEAIKAKFASFESDYFKSFLPNSPNLYMAGTSAPCLPVLENAIDTEPLEPFYMPEIPACEQEVAMVAAPAAIALKPPVKVRETFYPVKKKKEKAAKEKRKAVTIASDILFYAAVFVVLMTTVFAGGSGAPKVFMGYSYFTVLSSSMQDEIPKGSLILVRQTDPNSLEIGDNVTFMRDQSTSVTHKIMGVYENYQDSGERGFITKGVNNENPDRDVAQAGNIVGKVVISLPALGMAMSFLRANIYLMFLMFGLCVALSFSLRGLFASGFKFKKQRSESWPKGVNANGYEMSGARA